MAGSEKLPISEPDRESYAVLGKGLRRFESREAGRLAQDVGVPVSYQYSSKRLLYTAIGGTCKNTIGGTQWENF